MQHGQQNVKNTKNIFLGFDHLVEIRNVRALGEAKDLEHELKERIMTVWKLTEGPGVAEAGKGVFEDNNWNGQRVRTT